MSFTNRMIKNKRNILVFLCVIIIGIINILYTNSNYALNNLLDEFSYVSTSAYFAGYDWSKLTQLWSLYYNYGYSLLLVPFFVIFNNFNLIYYVAMLLNAVFLIGSFLLSLSVLKKILTGWNEYFTIIGCFCITLYTSNLVFSKWMWGEVLIVFLFWYVAYLLIDITEQFQIKKILLLEIVLIYLYGNCFDYLFSEIIFVFSQFR